MRLLYLRGRFLDRLISIMFFFAPFKPFKRSNHALFYATFYWLCMHPSCFFISDHPSLVVFSLDLSFICSFLVILPATKNDVSLLHATKTRIEGRIVSSYQIRLVTLIIMLKIMRALPVFVLSTMLQRPNIEHTLPVTTVICSLLGGLKKIDIFHQGNSKFTSLFILLGTQSRWTTTLGIFYWKYSQQKVTISWITARKQSFPIWK